MLDIIEFVYIINLEKYINNPRVLGLGEMMNYPGIIYKDRDVMDKLNLVHKNKKFNAQFYSVQ